MNNVSSKIVFLIAICVAIGCTTSNNKPVVINFSADRSVIVVTGINPVGLLQLKNNEVHEEVKSNWLTVRANGIKVPGKVSIKGDTLLFVPTTAFLKGQAYLVSTPLNTRFGDGKDLLQGQINYSLAPHQKLLQR